MQDDKRLEKINSRRCYLINKKYSEGLTEDEVDELEGINTFLDAMEPTIDISHLVEHVETMEGLSEQIKKLLEDIEKG